MLDRIDQPLTPAVAGGHPRLTARGKPLVGLAFCCGAWIGAGGVSHSAVIEAPFISGLSVVAADADAGLARASAASPPMATQGVIAQHCSDADEFVSPSPDCKKATEPAGSAPPPRSELPFGPSADPIVASIEISAAASVFDIAARRPSFDGLPPLPAGITPALLDEMVARPEGAADTVPFWAGKGDIVVNYAVPALAVLALVVGGLLLRELVRRRRRAALARRIKRTFGRSRRRHPAPRSSPRRG